MFTLALTALVVFSLLVEGMSLITIRLKRRLLCEFFSVIAVFMIPAPFIFLVVAWPNILSLSMLAISFYRVINILRIIHNRMHIEYLTHTTRRSWMYLLILQIAVMAIGVLWNTADPHGFAPWTIVSSLQLVAALIILATTYKSLSRTIWQKSSKVYTDKDLPSVTVAIPARNETSDLEECLRSIVASDYPKLEILVLDDSSQNRRTPEIIKSFAHDGVRFVQGDMPESHWLAKNQAYEKLATEASGKYIVFCGVDVRFSSSSIRNMISTVIDKDMSMLSILPIRYDSSVLGTSFAQAIRYMWELSLPRIMFRRPPVLSSCWIVNRLDLHDAGMFAGVARSITPEAHFAKLFAKKDKYRFYRSNTILDVKSTKSLAEQRATTIRMRYPQLHKRPENVALLSLLEVIFLVSPVIIAAVGLAVDIGITALLMSLSAAISLMLAYQLVAINTKLNNHIIGPLAQPLAAIYDVFLLNKSMYLYEFDHVNWKGRDISEPVMHATKSLPIAAP